MDGYVTPPQFPINPVFVNPGMQHVINQIVAQIPPDGPEVVDFTALPPGQSLGPLNEYDLLWMDRE